MRQFTIALAINVTGSEAWYSSISLQLDPGFKTGRVQGVKCVRLGGHAQALRTACILLLHSLRGRVLEVCGLTLYNLLDSEHIRKVTNPRQKNWTWWEMPVMLVLGR